MVIVVPRLPGGFFRFQPARAGWFILLIGASAGVAFEEPGKSTRRRPPPSQAEPPPLVPAPFSNEHYLTFLVEPRPLDPWRGLGAGAGRCGGTMFPRVGLPLLSLVSRPSKLADPVAALGDAYLKCQSMRLKRLEPRVPVELYPVGYFDEWVQDGWLITERAETDDEVRMQRLFSLLAEAIGEPEDEDDCWIDEPLCGASSSGRDIQLMAGLKPELAVEFVGGTPLCVDLSFAQARMLIRSGDRWGSFALNRQCTRALLELLAVPVPAAAVEIRSTK